MAFISPEFIGEIKKVRVALKYDSYPYQRFGFEHGIIIDISRFHFNLKISIQTLVLNLKVLVTGL